MANPAPHAAFSVEAALDAYVQANRSVRGPDGKFHPSSIFTCDRKAIYELRDVEPSNPRDARSHRVLFVGARWHEIVQAAVGQYGGADEVYTEVPVAIPELNIVGTADQLVRFGDTWELQEFKSISSRGFQYGGLPKPEHIQQAMVYMYALRTQGAFLDTEHQPPNLYYPEGIWIPPLGDALARARLTYISKDDLRIGEFITYWEPSTEDEIKAKVNKLTAYANDPLSLPPRLPLEKGKKNWLCQSYCEWRDRCWGSDLDEVAPDPDAF